MIVTAKLMNAKAPMRLFACSIPLLLSACASSGVYPLGGDKLMISKNTAKVGGGVSASATSEVHQEADAYCVEKNKKMEVTDLQLSPGRLGSLGNVTLQFRCI